MGHDEFRIELLEGGGKGGIPEPDACGKRPAESARRIRELTNRNRGASIERIAEQLSLYLRGWIGYFGKCETPSVLTGLEQRLRRRFRSAIWKQWKRGPARFAEIRRRDVRADLAAQTAASAHGPLRLADSPALSIALPNVYFDSLGIPRLTVETDRITRRTAGRGPACPVVWEGRSCKASPYPDPLALFGCFWLPFGSFVFYCPCGLKAPLPRPGGVAGFAVRGAG